MDDVIVANVDADKHKSLGGRFGVKGFPTLKFFPKGGDLSNPEQYNSGRTADDIVKYINEKANVRGIIKKAPTAVVDLDSRNFDKVVDGSKHVLVEFFAPWVISFLRIIFYWLFIFGVFLFLRVVCWSFTKDD